ncbi:MAG: PqqD family protein [Candidatus Omnitrophica bacterium]|nr:PqqD family protein [Candidatus Omnitrophota bacterium]
MDKNTMDNMKQHFIVRGEKQCVFRKIDEGEYFLSVYRDDSLSDKSSVVDVSTDNSFYLLNSSAALAWYLCNDCPTVESLSEKIVLNYKGEDIEKIKVELLDFLKKLYDIKLINFVIQQPNKKSNSVLVDDYYDEKDLANILSGQNNQYISFNLSPLVLQKSLWERLPIESSYPVETPTCSYPSKGLVCMDILPDIACPC